MSTTETTSRTLPEFLAQRARAYGRIEGNLGAPAASERSLWLVIRPDGGTRFDSDPAEAHKLYRAAYEAEAARVAA